MSTAYSAVSGTAAATTAPTAPQPQQRSTTTGRPPAGSPTSRSSLRCAAAARANAAARRASSSVRRRGTKTPGSTARRSPPNETQPSRCSSGSPATRRSTNPTRCDGDVAAASSSRASSSAKTHPAARSRATTSAVGRAGPDEVIGSGPQFLSDPADTIEHMLPQVLSAPLSSADARQAGVPFDQSFRYLASTVGREVANRHQTAGDHLGRVSSRATYLEVPLDLDTSTVPSASDAEVAMDLADAVEHARRSQGARGVVDLLVSALTDPRVRDDRYIDRYLETLKPACRQTRRYRELIPVLHRIADLNPARRFEIAAELAVVHGHLGERDKGVALLESAYHQQLRLAPARRCPE